MTDPERPVIFGAIALAVTDALTWNTIVSIQQRRIATADSDFERQLDLYLFALALRGVVRAAEFARQAATSSGDDEAHDRISEALDGFTDAVPDAKHVRDILEHFDKYRLGEGRLQRRRAMDELLVWVEDAGEGPVLVLGARYRLPVLTAVAAAGALADEVRRALHHER